MTTDNKNLTKAELLTLVADLQEKIAAVNSGAQSSDVEELNKKLAVSSAEAAAAQNRVQELIAQLADANAERGKLAALLEAAHLAHPPAQTPAATAATVDGPAIVVRTRQGREQPRYRAGRAFTREDLVVALSDLDQDQLDAIRGDRELVVTDYKPGQEA